MTGIALAVGLFLHVCEYVVEFATATEFAGLAPLISATVPSLVALAVRFIQNHRLLAGAVAWFMLRDQRREDRLQPASRRWNRRCGETLIPLVKEATAVITRNPEALEGSSSCPSDKS